MGIKNQHMMAKREKAREIELAKKANMWFMDSHSLSSNIYIFVFAYKYKIIVFFKYIIQ
jgi:hypothetical protein